MQTQIAVGTQQHFQWLQGIVKTVLVLNLLDALFTLVWVRWGLAQEANTLLDELVNQHAVGFVAVKLGLVSLGSWLLWNRRRRPLAVIAIFAAFLELYADDPRQELNLATTRIDRAGGLWTNLAHKWKSFWGKGGLPVSYEPAIFVSGDFWF